ILCYTLTRIKQDDIIEVEKLLQSKLNPKKRENVMKSIAHHWMQQGKEEAKAEAKAEAVKLVNIKMQEEKAIMVKKMQEEKIAIARNLIKAGLKIDLIATSTGLNEDEIKKLK
ncbi:MAG TPA: transposase, partial [Rickettsia endosymbiont of Bembidion nr. Transversale]|nr:transposase [Rickettsia endosymbiont of Bembidion nr. Transversale]